MIKHIEIKYLKLIHMVLIAAIANLFIVATIYYDQVFLQNPHHVICWTVNG